MKALSFILAGSAVAWGSPIVQTGLEVLRAANYSQLAGRKVIVLSNPTGVTSGLDLGVDVMFNSGAVDLVGVMGPEHGFRGTAQAGGSEASFTDPATGLTVYVWMISGLWSFALMKESPGRIQCQHEYPRAIHHQVQSGHGTLRHSGCRRPFLYM